MKDAFHDLQEKRADEALFRADVERLSYREGGGGNKPLKYFLLTAEYFWRWYSAGAKGSPKCDEPNRVIDAVASTVEHIYARSASSSVVELDPLVNELGNLTILTLTARRLIEAGVRFVNVTWEWYHRRANVPDDVGWDTHWKNFATLRKNLLPAFDQVFSALMEDLHGRGLLDETLVLVMSDFGRTPKINKDAGRDHWTHCYSVLLAGAGVRGGTVYGASDAHAAFVKEHPVRPADIVAIVYECLGIDPETPLYDHGSRPHPAAQAGRPIREILA
jgi:hypothetical protein